MSQPNEIKEIKWEGSSSSSSSTKKKPEIEYTPIRYGGSYQGKKSYNSRARDTKEITVTINKPPQPRIDTSRPEPETKSFSSEKKSFLAEKIKKGHMKIIEDISEYEEYKEKLLQSEKIVSSEVFFKKFYKFLEDYRKDKKENDEHIKCKKGCWSDFITKYLFAKEKANIAIAKYIYQIYPNNDPKNSVIDPSLIKLENFMPDEGFDIRYDFRQSLVYVNYYNMLMLDYDIKDGVSRSDAIRELKNIVKIGQENGLNFTFAVLASDRGLHAFLISVYAPRKNKNLMWVDFLRAACTDPYYAAFSYVNGYGMRLSKKNENDTDLVAWSIPIDIDDDKILELEDIDSNLEEFDFIPQYMDRKIKIKILDLNNITLIGEKKSVKNDIFKDLRLYYMFVQYFRNFDEDKKTKLECDIYNAAIHPYKSDIELLHKDIRKIIEKNEDL